MLSCECKVVNFVICYNNTSSDDNLSIAACICGCRIDTCIRCDAQFDAILYSQWWHQAKLITTIPVQFYSVASNRRASIRSRYSPQHGCGKHMQSQRCSTQAYGTDTNNHFPSISTLAQLAKLQSVSVQPQTKCKRQQSDQFHNRNRVPSIMPSARPFLS